MGTDNIANELEEIASSISDNKPPKGTKKKVMSILSVFVRLGFIFPIVFLLICLSLYILYISSKPHVHDITFNLNPKKLFCDIQTNILSSTNSDNTVTCQNTEVRHYCGNRPTISSNQPPLDPTNVYHSLDNDVCPDSKKLQEDNIWCGDRNIPPTVSGSTIPTIVTDNCCVNQTLQDNINYFGLFIFTIIIIVLLWIMIKKIFDIIYEKKDTGIYGFSKKYEDIFFKIVNEITEAVDEDGNKTESSEEKKVQTKIGKIIIWTLTIYLFSHFILLPLFRFFFVSYKCDSQHSSIQGSGDPSFTDVSDIHHQSEPIQISVCGINSILNSSTALTDDEINELYNQHITLSSGTAPATTRASQLSALQSYFTSNPTKAKSATIQYYKFLPRQNIHINDTVSPFTTSISVPDNIPGYNPLFNNFVNLEEYPITACSGGNQSICNKNHNCKWDGSNCINDHCPSSGTRYSLPEVRGLNTRQELDILDVHNKMFRNGRDFDASNQSYIDNTYPCNNVAIDILKKELAKNNISGASTDKSWVNDFELKRIECSGNNGKCYMDNYICQTDNGTPIPLKSIDINDNNKYTIPTFNNIDDNVCSNSMYPCGDVDPVDSSCKSLEIDSNNYLVENDNGGKCKMVAWNDSNSTWDLSSNSPNSIKMCVPNSKLTGAIPNQTLVSGATLPGSKNASWINKLSQNSFNLADINTHCKSVKRLPRTNIPNSVLRAPATGTSNGTPYFRWSNNNPLCSQHPNHNSMCVSPTELQSNNTYSAGDDVNTIVSKCCHQPSVTDDQNTSLYVSGTGTPVAVNSITPTQISTTS